MVKQTYFPRKREGTALIILGLLWPLLAAASSGHYDWGIAYYMSYDNNLAHHGLPIMAQIQAGIQAPNVVAAVQADLTDNRGMSRYAFTHDGMARTQVASEDSADVNEVMAYLRWFTATYPCRRYIFTFLNHGGKVDQMCCDKAPATVGREWISGHVLGDRLRALQTEMGGAIELLFLQQCGRGSIENLYSFRNTASFVMSSPVTVGAPNTYYATLHRWLAQHPDVQGDVVARKIALWDRDYTFYTCLRGDKLAELPEKMNRLLQPLLAQESLLPGRLPPTIYTGGKETVVDVRAYIDSLSRANKVGLTQSWQVWEWIDNELLISKHTQSKSPHHCRSYCGVSLYVPMKPLETQRYGFLDLYRDSRLPELWKRLAFRSR